MVLSAAAAAVMLVIAVWLAVESRRPADRVQQARTETDIAITATGDDAAQVERGADDPDGDGASAAPDADSGGEAPQKAPETGTVLDDRAPSRLPSLPAEVAILVLSPNLMRGDSTEETLTLASTPQPVRIQLDMEREEPYASFTAEVRTAQGRLVRSESGLPLHRTSYGWAVLFTMPEGLIRSGEYEVELKGIAGGSVEPVGYYYFTVLAR